MLGRAAVVAGLLGLIGCGGEEPPGGAPGLDAGDATDAGPRRDAGLRRCPADGGGARAVWAEVTPPTSAPGGGALTYDSRRGRIVLLGGGSTWEYDGATWIDAMANVSPGIDEFHGYALAYDAARGRTVAFGHSQTCSGLSCMIEAERRGIELGAPLTKEYDGVAWIDVSPRVSPSGRDGHAVAYDPVRARVVLYGGIEPGGQGSGRRLSDTWEYDGTTWIETTPVKSPPHRLGGMVYDAALDRIVLAGGYDGDAHVSDTWEYDGAVWTELHPAASPPGRDSYAMAYDAARGRVVLFGGADASGLRADTWEYDGTTWIETTPARSPPARRWASMAYDSARCTIVLFGGATAVGGAELRDTWEYRGP